MWIVVKKGIIALVIIIVLSGFTTADRGIGPVLETQGIASLTIINAFGHFDSDADLMWEITDDLNGLEGIPPLGDRNAGGSLEILGWEPFQAIAYGENEGATLYSSVYTEKTTSNGVGQIGYAKSLGVDTRAMLTGQSNIEATKQILYIGEVGGRVLSDDFISVDGTANPSPSARFGLAVNADVPAPSAPPSSDTSACIFAGDDESAILPAFCTYAESTSSIDLSVAHVRTTSDARFVVPSDDTPVILDHDIRVTDSVGKASAGMEVAIMESSPSEERFDFAISMFDPNTCHQYDFEGWAGISSTDTMEHVEISEYTSIDGTITLFDKAMRYDSGASR
jgi:hypothetical protein